MIPEILPISKGKLSSAVGLKRKKTREEKGLFLAEGHKCVEDLFSSFACISLLVRKDSCMRYMGLIEEASAKGSGIFSLSAQEMAKVSSFATPSDIIGVFCKPEPSSLPDKMHEYELLLDSIQDPGNLGTIIRAADWFGFRRIFASFETADVFNAKTIQATMGALGRVEVHYCDLRQLVSAHPEMAVYGLVLDGGDIYSSSLSASGFIVMGNEGNGIGTPLLEKITSPLRIPSYPAGVPTSESLNVAMATAITLAEFRRRQIMTKDG